VFDERPAFTVFPVWFFKDDLEKLPRLTANGVGCGCSPTSCEGQGGLGSSGGDFAPATRYALGVGTVVTVSNAKLGLALALSASAGVSHECYDVTQVF
jgi:hypothetical protein